VSRNCVVQHTSKFALQQAATVTRAALEKLFTRANV